MDHGQKLLDDWTRQELIGAIQDYQEMVTELDGLVNNALAGGTMVAPLRIRGIMEKALNGEGS